MASPALTPVSTRSARAGIGKFQMMQRAGGRQEPARGVLGIDARLEGVAGERDLVLRLRQLLAGGDAQLPFDEVEPGHHLGHRMLDLKPGVHLHEPEAIGPAARRTRRR